MDISIPPAPRRASGFDNDYWLLEIKHPKRLDPYTVECEDIIEAMNMPFAEACVFKAIWRLMQMRLGRGKPGATSEAYEAEKMTYYSQRTLAKIQNGEPS